MLSADNPGGNNDAHNCLLKGFVKNNVCDKEDPGGRLSG